MGLHFFALVFLIASLEIKKLRSTALILHLDQHTLAE